MIESKDKSLLAEMNEIFSKDQYQPISFNGNEIASEDAYVAWLDIMGAGSAMRRSLTTASSMIGKFHSAILSAIREMCAKDESCNELEIHSLTDGAYIVAHSPQRMQEALRYIMKHLVQIFLASNFENKFLVRCAVAYGKIVTAKTMVSRLLGVDPHANDIGKDLVRNVALGAPFEYAYKAESYAPPLGVFLDDSVLKNDGFGKEKIWKWWDKNDERQRDFCKRFNLSLMGYWKAILANYYLYGIDADKISNYIARGTSYYAPAENV